MQVCGAMSELKILSIPEQIAVHLRGEITRGRWAGLMPGRTELARQFGVGITSMEEALRQLEREGLLVAQGAGRMRRIVGSTRGRDKRRLRIAIMAYEQSTVSEGIFAEATHALREAGHDAFFTRSSLLELGMNVGRVGRLVRRTEADAWIVCSAPQGITESDPAFAWCRPSVAHVQWGRPPVIRRVVGWANNIARGKKDLHETLTRAEFIDGGTIGPVKR